MKAIILISSIFYILGLKISNKIDFVKKSNPVDKIISNKISADQAAKSIHFNEAVTTEADSLKSGGGGISDENLQKSK